MTITKELHEKLASAGIVALVRPVYDAGGEPVDVLAVLETVITGIVDLIVDPGHDTRVLDELFDRVKYRLAEANLKDIKPEGTA